MLDLWLGEMVSQETPRVQLRHQFSQHPLLILAVLASDKNVNVSTGRSSSTVRPNRFDLVSGVRPHQVVPGLLDVLKHLANFLSWNALFEIMDVLETYILSSIEQLRSFLQFLYRTNSLMIELLSFGRPDPAHSQ